MPVIKGLEWTFDTVASTYEKLRPGYVEELYRTIFAYRAIGKGSLVVEVGSGAGQATEPMLATGCELTAVEYGEKFSRLLTEKFSAYPGFSVVTGKFEEQAFEADSYDLVFSASAFHWVPEKIGYEKVFSMLKSGGAFARFANHPFRDKGNPALSRAMDELYDTYYNKYYHIQGSEKQLHEFSEEEARQRAMIAEKYGFCDITYRLFTRQRVFSAKEYVELLGTYSDHIAMEETIRREFFSQMEETIERHGGSFTIYDTIDLELARKP